MKETICESRAASVTVSWHSFNVEGIRGTATAKEELPHITAFCKMAKECELPVFLYMNAALFLSVGLV